MSQQSMLSSQETPTRNAAPRFTEDEKTVLIALLGEFKHIIEYKKTDVASVEKKNETWKEIAKYFDSNHGITRRDHVQLKKCCNSLKQKLKRKLQERSESATKLKICGKVPTL
ncbi:hypothetical protein HPB51_011594 [Rhipicephalus microplus]|uniref:Regulatory protein zeste n=1 Tax=Rhipicephalus microplus TaxID=6941 RepID=A0A9J6E8V1_RHIMP|nr:hypothetical protein HPB51_011594 [Rhipicephalus microplus]